MNTPTDRKRKIDQGLEEQAAMCSKNAHNNFVEPHRLAETKPRSRGKVIYNLAVVVSSKAE